MTLPDRFIDHASPDAMYRDAGLTRADIHAHGARDGRESGRAASCGWLPRGA